MRPLLLAAAAAGLLAALALTLLQSLWITPLILRAETYENATPAAHEHSHEHGDAAAPHEHEHDPDAWKPEDGWQRTLFTVAANVVMGVGYALLLGGVYLLWRAPSNALQGALFGIAGFVVFFAAPGLGLPPELPGTAAAELGARQQWWLETALATAAGLALLIAQSRWWLRVVGVALLLAPHLLGAPQPDAPASLAPETLQQQFRVATTACNALFWLLLGTLSATLWRKTSRPHA